MSIMEVAGLKGEKPADLPVARASKFDLVSNGLSSASVFPEDPAIE
jgi:hypothetical protein